MNNLADYFDGNYIHIDNNVKKDISDNILCITHAGFFTPHYCPTHEKQSENYYMFMIIMDGKGIIKYKDKIYNVSKGQCVYIDCRFPHYYLPDLKDPWGVIWINFIGPSADMYFNLFLQQKNNLFTPQNYEIIRMILTKIVDNNLHKTEATTLLNAKHLTDLLTTIILDHNSYDDGTSKFKHKLFIIKEYLDKNFTKQLNLDEIASHFYISKFYLTREFKKVFNTTVIQYILNKRIDYAKELLIHSNKSIEEISEACGFNDQSYFSRQFKKKENMTCLAYRKKNI